MGEQASSEKSLALRCLDASGPSYWGGLGCPEWKMSVYHFTEGRCACGRIGLVELETNLCHFCFDMWREIERKLVRSRRLMQPWSWAAMDANTEAT